MSDESASMPMHRLHPLSIAFTVGLAAKRLLLPGLIVLLVKPGGRSEIWLMIFFVPAVLAALAKYASYRYRLGPDELVVREGIITRNERHIPYGRIQNIDLVQNLFHRWFGVAEVRVETASGERPEAVMRVLSLSAVGAMREHVFRDGSADQARSRTAIPEATVEAPEPPLVKLGLRDLVLVGLTNHRGMAVVAAAMGLFWQLDPLGDIDEDLVQQKMTELAVPETVGVPGPLVTALLVAGGILLVLVLLTLLSIAWAAVRYHGFTLRARGDDLRSEYGLLTHITATIPRHRIQLFSMRRGPIHRWFSRTSVQVETAGQSHGGEGQGVDRLWLAPMIADRELGGLLEKVLPDVDLASLEWRPIAVRAWRRIIKRGIALALLISVAAGLALGWWAVAVLLAGTALAGLHARLYVKHAGYALAPEAVVYRSGWWTRKMSVVRYGKIQALALEESPFDRWNRMASIRVDTAGAGRVGHGVDIRYLEAEAAGTMMGRLAHETGVRPFRW
jgi:putative membrane protein